MRLRNLRHLPRSAAKSGGLFCQLTEIDRACRGTRAPPACNRGIDFHNHGSLSGPPARPLGAPKSNVPALCARVDTRELARSPLSAAIEVRRTGRANTLAPRHLPASMRAARQLPASNSCGLKQNDGESTRARARSEVDSIPYKSLACDILAAQDDSSEPASGRMRKLAK